MRQLLKGNEAVIHVVIAAGCAAHFGYPITPASKIAETTVLLMPKTGAGDAATRRNLITSIYLQHDILKAYIRKQQQKYRQVEEHECRWEKFSTEDAEIFLIGYGIISRVGKAAIFYDRLECKGGNVETKNDRARWNLLGVRSALVNSTATQEHLRSVPKS
jgi:pyruvate/2-oxoacid:ferredoxin oxidoreductase alpha subunit